MPVFKYKVISENGGVESGERAAPNRDALDKFFEKEGMVLAAAKEKKGEKGKFVGSGKIKVAELTDFLIYLSITNASGISVIVALEDFIEQAKNENLKKVLSNVLINVKQGLSLSEALAEHQKFFGVILVNVVRAGEETGALDLVLDKLRTQIEWQAKIKSTLKQVMIYPAFLCFAVTGLVVLLLTFLLPRVMGIYNESDIELPGITKVLIAASDFLRGNWMVLLGCVVAVPVSIFIIKRFEKGRVGIDRLVLKIPVLGSIIQDITLARFIVVFKTLIASGVEIVKSIQISGTASGNMYFEKLTADAIEQITKGCRLSAAFERFSGMNILFTRMISIGERTGKIVESLDCAYNFFDRMIPRKVSKMISLIEPTIIILAGVLVGFILLGALMPIYSMYEAL